MAVKAQNKIEPEIWGDVEIVCPICHTRKIINIPKRIIDESKQLTSILIPIGRICDHAFIPFIDKQFKVRGYQKLDVLLDHIEGERKTIIELKPEYIDVVEIKMNIRPELIVFAIHGCFFKKKILIVIDNKLEYLRNTIIDFFEYVSQNSFELSVLIRTKDEYKRKSQLYNDYFILYGKNVIGKLKNTIQISDLKLEDEITKEFYREGNSTLGLKNLRDNLRQTFSLTYKLIEFYKKQCNQEVLKTKKAISYLEDTHFMKIKKSYFQLLINIAEKYFNTKIILMQEKFGEILDQMWGL